MPERRRRGILTALTVPTFKMRIGQTFVVVLCIVLSLIIVGGIVLVRSSQASSKAQSAARLYEAADHTAKAVAAFDAAAAADAAGRTEAAISLSQQGRDQLAAAVTVLKPDGNPAAKKQTALLAGFQSMNVSVPAGLTGGKGAALVTAMNLQASKLLKESAQQGHATVTFGVVAYAIILVMTFILGMLTMTVAYRGISKVIRTVIEEVRAIATGEGDLTARVTVNTPDVHGELADAINDMVSSLRESTQDIRTIAMNLTGEAESLANAIESMSAAIQQVSAAAQQIATGSEDQARKVEDTSQAMGMTSRSIESIAEKARVSSQQSAVTADLAGRGEEAAGEAVEQMRQIYDSVKRSEVLMLGLGERFTQIGIIIDVITDIADQTNLLALNAAIEAARAGEHGKGFSVVAGEVRNLAENSKRSAEQISHLIREISAETDKVAASMAEGTERVESGRQVAEHTGAALVGILESSAAAAQAAGEISSSIQEIAGNTDSVFGAASDIAAIAEETAASTEEVAATLHEQRVSIDDISQASLELARLASRLHELTEGYKL